MLSYSHGTSSTPLLGQTIGDDLELTVARVGEREALVCPHQDVRLTYAELDAKVDELARALMAAGLEKGDRLALWSPNRVEWVLTQYATAKAGVILVNVNPAYRASELKYVLGQSGARMLISARAHKTSDYAAMIEQVRGDVAELERVVVLDGPDWDELVAGADAVTEDELRERSGSLSADDPINIQYTSGTTGFPKGATLSHHNILNNGFFVGEYCRYTEQDRVCIPVPFYHCFGMVMGNLGCTTHGACMVVPAEAFEPEATLRAVADEKCTSLYGVPTMFIAELDLPDFGDYDLSSLRTGIMAGSPCPVEVMKKVVVRDAHGGGVHLLRHDRDLAGVHPDLARRPAGAARGHGRPRAPARGGQGGRPGHRADAAARRGGRAVHPRLLGDAGLLGGPRAHGRGHRLRPLDAHR